MLVFSQFIKIFTLFLVGILAFAIGLAAGYIVLKPTATTSGAQIAPQTSLVEKNKATEFRLKLQLLQQEHMHLLSAMLQAHYNRSSDLGAVRVNLKANAQELGELLGIYYGEKTKDAYIDLQETYSISFANYATALKAGNKTGMDTSLNALIAYTESQAALLNKANPSLPKDGVKQLTTDTVMFMKESIDAYASREYPLAYTKQRQAYAQSGSLADAHATAIIKQFPEQFKR
ncbi:MAG: hypothetical protein H0W89_04830 [Candidatus Levybacteria bacterium]|nr:hypothetical protein [Candidatus Levybacteria bacterium]